MCVSALCVVNFQSERQRADNAKESLTNECVRERRESLNLDNLLIFRDYTRALN